MRWSKKNGRYWLFAFDEYPVGGIDDFLFSFDDVEEFEEKLPKNPIKFESYQLLDTQTHYYFTVDFSKMVKWVCKNVGNEDYEKDNNTY